MQASMILWSNFIHNLIVEWVTKAFDTISVNIVQHSWRYGFFLGLIKLMKYLCVLHLFFNEYLH